MHGALHQNSPNLTCIVSMQGNQKDEGKIRFYCILDIRFSGGMQLIFVASKEVDKMKKGQ